MKKGVKMEEKNNNNNSFSHDGIMFARSPETDLKNLRRLVFDLKTALEWAIDNIDDDLDLDEQAAKEASMELIKQANAEKMQEIINRQKMINEFNMGDL